MTPSTVAKGVIELGRHKVLDDLSAFTIEATVTPQSVGPERQNILEGQSPGIAMFMSPEGKLVGSMLIDGAWQGLDSGSVTLKANEAINTGTKITFRKEWFAL